MTSPFFYAIQGQLTSDVVQIMGGIPPYSFSITGTLPVGITFNDAAGVFSGTPTAAPGLYILQVTFTDSESPPMSHSGTVEIYVEPNGSGG